MIAGILLLNRHHGGDSELADRAGPGQHTDWMSASLSIESFVGGVSSTGLWRA
jgi:hypothetical protein